MAAKNCATFRLLRHGDRACDIHRIWERQLTGYGLITAHILYCIPLQSLPQTHVWQDYDLAPDFPEMQKLLNYWQALTGLGSVRSHLDRTGRLAHALKGEFKLH
ncbi:aspartate-semialdehyde dehydrogenase (plasmid) [Rhizobium hidalgonense]|nr:aspartate-semialdehyde dehydrogenase [Rhizobium hidalgonense]